MTAEASHTLGLRLIARTATVTVGAAGLLLGSLTLLHSSRGDPWPALSVAPGPAAAPSTASRAPSATSDTTVQEPPSTAPTDRVSPAWAERVSEAAAIPYRALLAYASADLTIDAEQPDCGIGWNTLAAIGAVESAHGYYSEGTLRDDGYPDPPIRGVALNGQGVAAIEDTDGGVLDGDTTWDRATGPLQFIPSTWETWGADGNGDGVADPNQIDDAALAAARYVCASGPVITAAQWRQAVWSYNHSDDYVDRVAAIAHHYAVAVEAS